MCWRLWRLCGGGCGGYVVAVEEAMWWLEELKLKQALQFSFGLGLCNKKYVWLQTNKNKELINPQIYVFLGVCVFVYVCLFFCVCLCFDP
jgi:hypothetical protein